MAIKMVFRPREVVSEERFYGDEFPSYAIAYDGFVNGPPGFLSPLDGKLYESSEKGFRRIKGATRPLANWPKVNFDHHAGVVRLATNSSAAQAFLAVKCGLMKAFSVRGVPTAHLYGNDPDQDGTKTTFILINHDSPYLDTPMFRDLLSLHNHLDITAGTYRVKKRWHILQRLIWIGEPYTLARQKGLLAKMNAEGMRDLVLEGHERIIKTIEGEGEEVEPDMRFEVLEEYDGWKVVNEIGQHARYGMHDLDAFLTTRDRGDGSRQYMFCRRSKYIWHFPTQLLLPALNRAEKKHGNGVGGWGGSDTFVCSPRDGGSLLPYDTVVHKIARPIIERAMAM
ncbi:MAG: hypothetical protein RLZZ324_1194 [Candidatus Parcubacteria bacterium]|jgi:hypothetical protein